MLDKPHPQRRIWFIGPFPPPLHGQAGYNVAMAAHLREMGDVRIIDTGSISWRKVAVYLGAAWTMLTQSRRGDVVYTSAPGQGALWLFGIVVLALRCRGLPFFVHHHSYRPIHAGPTAAMRFVIALGGQGQRHILLSEHMRRAFVDLYLDGDVHRALALSNAFLFYEAEKPTDRPDRPLTLGHMSVLASEKGVDVVLAVFENLMKAGADVRLLLAGPVRDSRLTAPIAAVAARYPQHFEVLGRVDGDAKRQFYNDIDLFLLPSRLLDEAEPLVLFEAYAAGVDVMATERGCIPERLIASDRILTGDSSVDTASVSSVATGLASDWSASRSSCRDHATRMHASACQEAQSLFMAMGLEPTRRPATRAERLAVCAEKRHLQDSAS